jgi:hypothetical protein
MPTQRRQPLAKPPDVVHAVEGIAALVGNIYSHAADALCIEILYQ